MTTDKLIRELHHRASVISSQACDTGGYALAALHDAIAALVGAAQERAPECARRWARDADFGSGAWKREADDLVTLLDSFAESHEA